MTNAQATEDAGRLPSSTLDVTSPAQTSGAPFAANKTTILDYKYPYLYYRVHLSNIPDYIGGKQSLHHESTKETTLRDLTRTCRDSVYFPLRSTCH